jgi:hypothetical protein
VKLGTSLRFLYPTSPATHDKFRSLLASRPKGAFIERPMGAYSPDEQAKNLMEVASAARAAGLDALLTGDSHCCRGSTLISGQRVGRSNSLRPSPARLKLRTVRKIAVPGKNGIHQACCRKFWA